MFYAATVNHNNISILYNTAQSQIRNIVLLTKTLVCDIFYLLVLTKSRKVLSFCRRNIVIIITVIIIMSTVREMYFSIRPRVIM